MTSNLPTYTVILMYPVSSWPSDDEPQTYCETVAAENPDDAVRKVRNMMLEANEGNLRDDDILLLYVLAGEADLVETCMD